MGRSTVPCLVGEKGTAGEGSAVTEDNIASPPKIKDSDRCMFAVSECEMESSKYSECDIEKTVMNAIEVL